jgi:hypothetical protein
VHEDDAERATRCGLALVDRMPQLDRAEELHARVGIATGLVVVGGEVAEHDVTGDTPNLAARLQALAEPDTVVIAASTRRLTCDHFDYRELGDVALKGFDEPVSAWQVLGESAVESRSEAQHEIGLTLLIGRKEKTLAALLAQLDGLTWEQPVLMLFEDLHWIDPTSLELLRAMVDRVQRLPVLLLATARPEFTPPWPSQPTSRHCR